MYANRRQHEFQSSATSLHPPVSQFPPQIAMGYPPPPQHPIPIQHHQQYHQQQQGFPTQWSTGICGCGQDPYICCLTCFCPCITFGKIAEILDEGSPPCFVGGGIYALMLHFTGCPCLYSCFYRSKMRAKFNLPESPCGDCLVHFFCEHCALNQEYRELKNRGYDPALGWAGIVEKQRHQQHGAGMSMAAPVAQAMMTSRAH